MARFFANEKWVEFAVEPGMTLRYAISNYGRLVSFEECIEKGNILRGARCDGYPVMRFKYRREGKVLNKTLFFHKLVAMHFLMDRSDDQVYVIHLDHNKANNMTENLKWVTRREMVEHNKNSPAVQKAFQELIEYNKQRPGKKLTATQVILIKKKILNPNRKTRMRLIAKQFGISEMQLYRIKTGENWGHIKVDQG